jgi:hypothetical protein
VRGSALCPWRKGPVRRRPWLRRSRRRLRWRHKANGLVHEIPSRSVAWRGCAAGGCASRGMPGKRVRGERLLEDALDALIRALGESGAAWMVIGGIAIIARGVRRFTTDIDVAVRGDAIRPSELLVFLKRQGIVPRVKDALAFAEENLVLLACHEPTGVDLDVSFAWSSFEHDALAASTLTAFGRVRAPMCTPENLVVFKAIAGRPRDIEDAESLLVLHPRIDVARVRKRVAELSALAEAPELLHAFDAMLTKVRGPETRVPTLRGARSPSKKSPATKKRRRSP